MFKLVYVVLGFQVEDFVIHLQGSTTSSPARTENYYRFIEMLLPYSNWLTHRRT